jgi:membrane protein implicated in regulation of membrane protease activity
MTIGDLIISLGVAVLAAVIMVLCGAPWLFAFFLFPGPCVLTAVLVRYNNRKG